MYACVYVCCACVIHMMKTHTSVQPIPTVSEFVRYSWTWAGQLQPSMREERSHIIPGLVGVLKVVC